MSQKIAGLLPSLADLVIATPSQGAKSVRPGLFLPPFPDIDLNNWAGFTFSHLHWLGFRMSDQKPTEDNLWQFHLAVYHELCHKHLAMTPFLRVKRAEVLRFYTM